MAWTSRGLRGSTLEEMINRTNEQYRDKHLALIQKVPTPITPIKIDKESRHITLAYFEKKSTVDYIGAVQGIPVCFDAKECKTDSFPLANIHEHQVTFMKDFEQQGGISFLLLYFTARDEYYYLRYEMMKTFWDRGQNGGKKHFSYTELETSFFLPRTGSSVLLLINIEVKLNSFARTRGRTFNRTPNIRSDLFLIKLNVNFNCCLCRFGCFSDIFL